MPNNILEIKDLEVSVENKEIIKKLDLAVERGKVSVLMGPNGSGKSTLAQTLMGHPSYIVTAGLVMFEGKNLLEMSPDERSQAGLFLSFQHPSEITGVTISSYLRMIYNKKHGTQISPVKFREILKPKLELLSLNASFLSRYLNDGFSGGEKKRMEILQLMLLEPKLAILDETDSGLDIDAIKTVSNAVVEMTKQSGMTVLIITHYTRILKHLSPDKVFIMQDGKIVEEGDEKLADRLEEQGYAQTGE